MTTRGYGDRWWEQDKPADLEKTNVESAAVASQTSKDSYTKKITRPLVKGKQYKFFFTYYHQDPDTQEVKESDRSPVWTESFTIPNLTKAVQNLTLTAGSQSYGVKFTLDPLSVQEDVVIFESLTSDFATQTIVYTGTSTNVSILTTGTTAFSPRWVKVRSRDKWDDLNISEATAGPVTPFSADVDTTYTVANPTGTTNAAVIDPKDLSGFSVIATINWTQSADIKTAGYAIRWSTNDPSVVGAIPLWEYASVNGRTTTSFNATGLVPNTTYYYQVASTTPYDVVNWTGAASGTFIASDADGTAAGALARLKSYIAIGGASQDLFKIGTGISQSINLNTDPLVTPPLTPGNYHGIILNKSTTNVGNNFWLTTGQFRVGNPTEFMYWNGTNLYLTGSINATGGKFTGNVQLAIPTGGTTSGTLYAGANPTSGARVRLSSEGIFAYNSSSINSDTVPGNTNGLTFALQQATGQIYAVSGIVGGWTLATTGLSSSNTKIESNGTITLGDTTGTLSSIIRLSATDPYRIWVGSQDSTVAKDSYFAVSREGVLYARNAVITGNVVISSGGTYDSIVAAQQAASSASSAASSASSAASTASSNASAALTTANGKNSIFRSASTPSALKEGDIWINWNDENKLYVSTAAGTGSWVLSRDAAISSAVNKADAAQASANAAVATANAAYPASNFSKSAILQAINASTNGAKLSGEVLETGTVLADNVVSTYVYAGYISADKINAGTLTGRAINNGNGTFSVDTSGNVVAQSGQIGGFNLTGVTDLEARTADRPRIIFGTKISLGWDDDYTYSNNYYGLRIGNSFTNTGARMVINTKDNVFRASIDTTRIARAFEVTNTVRAVNLEYTTSLIGPTSSRRFKDNITYLPKTYYEKILDIKPAVFVYKNNEEVLEEIRGSHGLGLIAEDLEDAGLGYFVQRDMQGRPTQLMDAHELSYLLIPIVKDMKEEIAVLKNRIETLENV
jgi:hypothetical protein